MSNPASRPTAEDFSLAAYDYNLPPVCIAQNPVVPRDRSRLLVVTSPTEQAHHHFFELPDLLRPGDLLVFNNTRVIPARLYGQKVSGAAIEVLLLEEQASNRWLALVKPGRRLKPGAVIRITNPETGDFSPLQATIQETDPDTGGRILQFEVPEGTTLWDWLGKLGQTPLPPYITNSTADAEQYQTIYSQELGAVAAPTAGLHFTPTVFEQLQAKGIEQAFITLHVGVGTFRPVESDEIQNHTMHSEWVEVSEDALHKIQQAQQRGGRIIAVGTTVVRTLEGVANLGPLQPYRGKVNLFIYPGYDWQVVDGLITNFHLPRSSLLMLVSALVGRLRLLELYQLAIERGYRFYSFGDAMLILPESRLPWLR